VVTEYLAAEGDQGDPGQVEDVEGEQPAVKGGDFAEETVVDEPAQRQDLLAYAPADDPAR
jgi:hypothetical protein